MFKQLDYSILVFCDTYIHVFPHIIPVSGIRGGFRGGGAPRLPPFQATHYIFMSVRCVQGIRTGAMFGPRGPYPLREYGSTPSPRPNSLGNTVGLKYCTSREYSLGEEADSIPWQNGGLILKTTSKYNTISVGIRITNLATTKKLMYTRKNI